MLNFSSMLTVTVEDCLFFNLCSWMGETILLLLQHAMCMVHKKIMPCVLRHSFAWKLCITSCDAFLFLVGYTGKIHIALYSYAFKILLEVICHGS
jgi:hypothetical protein